MTLALTLLTAATAWAGEYVKASYIDADGNAQTTEPYTAIVVDTSMEGNGNFISDSNWFFVRGNVTLNGASNEDYTTQNIILGDNATLTINGGFQFTHASVNIYCQSGGTGKLVVSGSYGGGGIFHVTNTNTLTINGGTVEVTNTSAGLSGLTGNLVMNGGTASFNASFDPIYGTITLNGGTFTASSKSWEGICSSTATIADGKYFKDSSGNVYTGTLTDSQKEYLSGKTLTPATQAEYIQAGLGAGNDGSAAKPYTINDANGWNAFCLALEDNTYNHFSGKNVKLGKNIAVTRMAGGPNHEFMGNFDGGGNTLTFTLDASDNYAAPFCRVKGGSTAAGAITISDLNVVTTITAPDYRHAAGLIALQWGHVNVTGCTATVSISSTTGSSNPLLLYPAGLVSHASADTDGTLTISGCTATGTIATNGKYAGGLVGIVQGTTTITNCRSSVTIESSTSGDGTHGGLVGVLDQTSGSNLTITGCLFNGKLLTKGNTPTNNCGGFVGWNAGTLSISNSLYAPAAIGDDETEVNPGVIGQHPSATFARDAANSISNCYYTRTLGTAQGLGYSFTTAPVNIGSAGTAYSVSGITPYTRGLLYGGRYYMTPEAVSLADNAANDVDAINGYFSDVTLSGRTLYKDGDWNTLCLPFDLVLEGSPLAGAEARTLSTASIDGTTLDLTFGDPVTTLTAGTPYIIKWTKADGYVDDNAHNIYEPVFSGVTISSTTPTPVTFDNGKVSFVGTYAPIVWDTENQSILFLGAENTLYWPQPKNGQNPRINAFRAYFDLTDGNAGVREFKLNFGDGNGSADVSSAIIADGDVRAPRGWYTLDGRKLDGVGAGPVPARLRKGVYLHGGKKVVVK